MSTDDYLKIGEIAGAFAGNYSGGKIFSVLEGGYYIPDLGENVIALLAGISNTISI